jgi:ubiquitin-protein ligase
MKATSLTSKLGLWDQVNRQQLNIVVASCDWQPRFISLTLFCALEETPYFGGAFQVKVVLGNDFPTAPPKCKA